MRAVSASKEEVWIVGMRLSEKKARMTSLMASVETMRTMLSRPASMVDMVDFPTPVEPPMRITRGRLRRLKER